MTRDDLIERLERLRDEAAPVDTDTAAVLAVLARLLAEGCDISDVSEACFDAETRLRARPAKERRQ